MRKPTEKQLAYIAGFFDGEGCVQIHGSRNRRQPAGPYIWMGQKSRKVLDEIQGYLGFGKITQSNRGHHILRFSRQDGLQFARWIAPYAIVKREQLLLAIEMGGLIGESNNTKVTEQNRRRRFEIFRLVRGMHNQ